MKGGRGPAVIATAILVGTIAGGEASGQGPSERGGLSSRPLGEVRTLPGVPTFYRSVALSPDGGTVAAGERDGLVRVWRVAEGAPSREIRGRIVGIEQVAISPDGCRLAASGAAKFRIDDDPKSPSPGWKYVEGAVLDVWDVASGRRIAAIDPPGIPYGLVFDPGGATIAAVFSGDVAGLGLWQADGGKPIRTLGGPGNLARGMFFRGPEVPVIFGRDLGHVAALELLRPATVRLWTTEVSRVDDLFLGADLPCLDCCALSPDGRSLAVIDEEQTLTICSTAPPAIRQVGRRPPPQDLGPFPSPDSTRRPLILAFDPSGDRVVAGVADGSLRVYDARTAEVREVVRGPAAPVRALSFAGGRLCVIAGGWSIPINGEQKPTPLLFWQAGPTPSP